MADFWCKEHKVAFFKKGGMKGFAHPIGDTGKWCNMPEGQEPESQEPEVASTTAKVATQPEPMSKKEWADKDATTKVSIEKQQALKCAVELASAGVIPPVSTLSYAEVYYRWLKGDIEVSDEAVFKSLIEKHFKKKEE